MSTFDPIVVLYLRVPKSLKDSLADAAVADHERRRQLAGGWHPRLTVAEYAISVLDAHVAPAPAKPAKRKPARKGARK